MKKTGIIASTEEVEALKSMLSTPLIAINCGSPQRPDVRCHEMALAHGLPEIRGRYGIDLITGEFVAP